MSMAQNIIEMAIENIKEQIREIKKYPQYNNAKSMLVSAMMYYMSAKQHLSARNKIDANRCVGIAIGMSLAAEKKIKKKTMVLALS